MKEPLRTVLFANTDWYLYNFRRSLAAALRDAGGVPMLVSPPGAYGARLRALGFSWSSVLMSRRSLNAFRELDLVISLCQLLRVSRPALVHSHTIKCAVYGSLAARLLGIPRVNAVAGLGYVFSSSDLMARLLRPFVRGLLRFSLGGPSARLVLQNPDDVEWFVRERLVSPSSIRLIRGSGVDTTRFVPRGADARSGPVRVLLAGRMLVDKGVHEFVAAARTLRGRAVFVLAGDPDPGNPAAIPLAELRAWADEGVVEWLGHVDDMAALYRSVDVCVLPSYREGLPKGLIEAGACGLALVTTDVPGCREVVTHEVDGLLVPVRDAGALAAAITRLVEDASLRSALGSAAREKALREFDERIVIEKTLAVYRELLPEFPNR